MRSRLGCEGGCGRGKESEGKDGFHVEISLAERGRVSLMRPQALTSLYGSAFLDRLL
jgi:hypothetical protein